jgi:hypothetical protein
MWIDAVFISYLTQLMPLTPSSVYRDDPSWVAEMLPVFKASCDSDKSKTMSCIVEGNFIP